MSQPTTPLPVGRFVSMDARYLGAWGEINARIGKRQDLLTLYTTVAIASLGVASADLARAGSQPDPDSLMWRAAYMIPAASLMFSSLLLMHERAINNLQKLLARLEERSKIDSDLYYHHPGDLMTGARDARRLHDIVAIGLMGTLNVAAFVICFLHWEHVMAHEAAVQVAMGGVSLIAMRRVLRIRDLRHQTDDLAVGTRSEQAGRATASEGRALEE